MRATESEGDEGCESVEVDIKIKKGESKGGARVEIKVDEVRMMQVG